MYCNNCGNANAEGKFCDVCGAEIIAEPVAVEAEPVVTPENVVDAAVAVDPGKTLGTVSMILGIAALVLGSICSCLFSCLGGSLPLIAAVVGVILGIMAMNKSKAAGFKNKSALIGVILCAATIVIVLVFIGINAIVGGIIGASTSSGYYY